MRSGSDSDSECAKPDWSVSGATTHTSSVNCRAIRSRTWRPSAWMPSSFVRRIRISVSLVADSTRKVELLRAPLCPPEHLSKGGHLPHKGGDRLSPTLSPTARASGGASAALKADLPPCGGDVRQDRGGPRRARTWQPYPVVRQPRASRYRPSRAAMLPHC